MTSTVNFVLNGEEVSVEAKEGYTLLDLLKYELRVNSVKMGCETGECGVCTVLLEDRPVASCLVLAQKADGKTVETLEGLNSDPMMRKLQGLFVKNDAAQCGFCTPGMLISLYSLFKGNLSPSDDEIATAIEGNLCRCGTYIEVRKSAMDLRDHIRNSARSEIRKPRRLE